MHPPWNCRFPRSRTAEATVALPTELDDVAVFIDRVRGIPIKSQMTD
jgi:hypothetical protein